MKKRSLLFFLAFFFSATVIKAQMRIHLINVGQGCATLVEFPCGAILIDIGGEKNEPFNAPDSLRTYLNEFFERRTDLNRTLQCVYITHPHTDHTDTNQVKVILDGTYTIKNIVTDGLEQGSGKVGQKRLHQLAQASTEDNDTPGDDIGLEAISIDRIGPDGLTNAIIDAVNCSGTDPIIKILWGTTPIKPSNWTIEDFDNENFHSLVIKIQYGTSSFLITGDLEDKSQKDLLTKYSTSNILDADVYLVGHHGSSNGSSVALLNKITPKMALIGVADTTRKAFYSAYSFGHPTKIVLERLQAVLTETRAPITVAAGKGRRKFEPFIISKAIYATGWDGSVILQADANGNWQKVSKLVPPQVNVNTASLSELLTLPGIGETKAKAIIEYRSTHPPFTNVEQLDDVPGIGPATITLLRPYVRF